MWQPEDWKEFEIEPAEEGRAQPEHHRAALSVLRRLPAGPEYRVAELHAGADTPVTSGLERFARRERVALDELIGSDGAPPAAKFDLCVAVDSFERVPRAELNRLFRRVRSSLVEGGLFLATIAASERGRGRSMLWPQPPRTADDVARLHEFELQYRLRRAGFLGARLHRFRRVHETQDALLCTAVRRASN